MVLLSTEHVSAAAHANRPSKKLEPNFIGPFKITEVVNDNAFRLELPSTMHQHPVFNADQLKTYTPSPPIFSGRTPPRPPPLLVDGTEEYEVESILDYKIDRKTPKWLVKWKGYPLDDATWETKTALKHAKDILSAFEANRTK